MNFDMRVEDLRGAEQDLTDSQTSLREARRTVRFWERRVVEDMVKVDDLRKALEAH